MEQWVVHWCGAEVVLATRCAAAIEYLRGRGVVNGSGRIAVLPSDRARASPALQLEYHDGLPETLEVAGDHAVLRGQWQAFQRSGVFDAVLLALLERGLHKIGRFSLRASAVAFDGRAYLLAGPRDSGKTSLAYSLCRAGGRLLANGKAVVGRHEGRISVLDGDRDHLTFRSHSLETLDPTLHAEVFGATAVGVSDLRRHVTPEQARIPVAEGPVHAARVFAIGLGLTDRLECRPLTDIDSRVMLYRNICGRIRGSRLVLFDADDRLGMWLPDFSTDETHQEVVGFLEEMFAAGLVFTLRGPLEAMVAHVRSLAAPSETLQGI